MSWRCSVGSAIALRRRDSSTTPRRHGRSWKLPSGTVRLGHFARLPYDSFMSTSAQDTLIDENARYKRVIRSAEELFKKLGFRAVTMELVAREANVAKATLYSYFKNKDELFLAVCARMAGILRASVEQALTKPDAPLDARLTEAVIAKQRPIFALVRGSAHAAELFTYTHSMAGEVVTDLT